MEAVMILRSRAEWAEAKKQLATRLPDHLVNYDKDA